MTTTWNPSTLTRGTLSTDDLTLSYGSGSFGAAFSTTNKTSGKLVFEIEFAGSLSDAAECGVASMSASQDGLADSFTNGIGYTHFSNGNLYFNGSQLAALGNFSPPGFIMVAVDFGAKLFWIITEGNDWNSESPGADPATGTGGIDITALSPGSGLQIWASVNNGATATLNTVGSFHFTPPSGFTAWDGAGGSSEASSESSSETSSEHSSEHSSEASSAGSSEASSAGSSEASSAGSSGSSEPSSHSESPSSENSEFGLEPPAPIQTMVVTITA